MTDLITDAVNAFMDPELMQIQADYAQNAQLDADQGYQDASGYLNPYYIRGTAAMKQLYNNVSNNKYNVNVTPQNLQNDPGYQFQLQQGQQALQRSAAAQGGLNSGGFMKAMDQYSQGLASTQYQNAWNRQFQQNQFNYNSLANMAGMGQQEAGNMAALRNNYTNQQMQLEGLKSNIWTGGMRTFANDAGGTMDSILGLGMSSMGMNAGPVTPSQNVGMGNQNYSGFGGGQGASASSQYAANPNGYSLGAGNLGSLGYDSAGGYGGYGSSTPSMNGYDPATVGGGYGGGYGGGEIPPQAGGSYGGGFEDGADMGGFAGGGY